MVQNTGVPEDCRDTAGAGALYGSGIARAVTWLIEI
jgi:hypothetical protein